MMWIHGLLSLENVRLTGTAGALGAEIVSPKTNTKSERKEFSPMSQVGRPKSLNQQSEAITQIEKPHGP